jgi:hypothetical protein
MANWAVNDYVTPEGSLPAVVAALETQLETLDSTNDPIQYIDVILQPNGTYVGVLVTS